MVQSIGDVLKRSNKAVLDEVDVRHWIERYLFSLLGSVVRCSEVGSGKVVLVSKLSTIRQELQLVLRELRVEALAQVGYKINKVKVVRFN